MRVCILLIFSFYYSFSFAAKEEEDCRVTFGIATGVPYRIKSDFNGKVVNIHGNEKLMYPIKDDSPKHPHRLWVFAQTATVGHYRIKSTFNGKVWNVYGNEKLMLPAKDDSTNHPHRVFDLVGTSKSGCYRIRSCFNGKVVNIHGNEKLMYPIKDDSPNHPHRLWKFVPPAHKLKASIESFVYGRSIQSFDDIARIDEVVEWSFSNHGTTPDVHHVTVDKTRTMSYGWRFIESKETEFFNKLDVDVKAAYWIFSGSAHNTTTWTNREKSLKEEKKHESNSVTVAVTSDITVQSGKRKELKSVWKTVDVDIPFTATVKVTAICDLMSRMSGAAVASFLELSGYTDFSSIGADHVVATINGIAKVSGAISGQIQTTEHNI